MDADLQHLIATHGVNVVVCLLSDAELRALGVGRDYAERVNKAGLELIQLPIIEMFAPEDMVRLTTLLLLYLDGMLLHAGRRGNMRDVRV